jgi:streptomycin 6-kinase
MQRACSSTEYLPLVSIPRVSRARLARRSIKEAHIDVPPDLRRTITAWAGAAGAAWLDALPAVVAALAAEWSLTVGEPYVPSGVTGLAVRVTTADGTPAVLKVRYDEDGDAAPEAAALRHFGGRAAVALLAADDARGALLLERCVPGTPLLGRPDAEAADAICALLPDLWSPVPEAHPFRSTNDLARRWRETLAGATSVDPALRDEAVALAADLAAYDGPEVVLHGDLHAANVLAAQRRPWLAIDPKGYVGDPARDVAAMLRDRATPNVVGRRLAAAAALGLDPARCRAWALAQAVEGAVWSYERGHTAGGDAFAREATALATLPG